MGKKGSEDMRDVRWSGDWQTQWVGEVLGGMSCNGRRAEVRDLLAST